MLLSALLTNSTPLFLLFFFVNFFISACFSYFIINYSIPHFIKHKNKSFIFLLAFQSFIPIFGIIGALVAISLLKNYRRVEYSVEISVFPRMGYLRKNSVKTVSYGEGWASIRLKKSSFDQNERKKALISLSKSSSKDTNLIYSELVSDDMEELRICAFSLLENKQDYLHEKINQLLKIYQNADSVRKTAFFAKQLALVYWELVYLNLTDNEFRKIILERSHFYAMIALDFFKDDPFLWILLSRISTANGDIKKGLELLNTANSYNAPTSKTYPYFAESSYHNHDYDSVRNYLSFDESFKDIPKISKIATFWCP